MKATLEFQLPEDTREHALACHAHELYSALLQIQQSIRNTLKYTECSAEIATALEELRSLIPFDVLAHIDGG